VAFGRKVIWAWIEWERERRCSLSYARLPSSFLLMKWKSVRQRRAWLPCLAFALALTWTHPHGERERERELSPPQERNHNRHSHSHLIVYLFTSSRDDFLRFGFHPTTRDSLSQLLFLIHPLSHHPPTIDFPPQNQRIKITWFNLLSNLNSSFPPRRPWDEPGDRQTPISVIIQSFLFHYHPT